MLLYYSKQRNQKIATRTSKTKRETLQKIKIGKLYENTLLQIL